MSWMNENLHRQLRIKLFLPSLLKFSQIRKLKLVRLSEDEDRGNMVTEAEGTMLGFFWKRCSL